MKKSLLLAAAMSVAICGSVYAANPFSDVPAGHWAYDSIHRLAQAGVIEGYGDDTFRGDRLMTRYEMAQIVAKAMAKGANVEKLAAEFADELDALGVRVAALEKKQDNVRITGEARFHYTNVNGKGAMKAIDGDNSGLRTRIWLNGEVNDNWHYVGMLENQQDFSNNVGDEDTNFQRAYLDGRLGGLKVQAGRFHQTLAEGNVYDNRMDGIDVKYGDKIKVGAYYGKPSEVRTLANQAGYTRAWGLNANADLGEKINLFAGYDRFDRSDFLKNNAVWNVGLNAKLGKDVVLGGMYLHSGLDVPDRSNNGFVVKAQYAGAVADKVGTFGVNAKYYNQGVGTFNGYDFDPISVADGFVGQGFKGYSLGANYTVAKNMVLGAQYYDLKGKEDSNDRAKVFWGDLTVRF